MEERPNCQITDCKSAAASLVPFCTRHLNDVLKFYRPDADQAFQSYRCLTGGEAFPFDGLGVEKDWAHRAARGVFYDLCDRAGFGILDSIDKDVRVEIVAAAADIIRMALTRLGR